MTRVGTILTGLCCCVIGCVPMLGQSTNSNDQKFVDMAAQTDMAEAHLGQMAADQASSQDVKDFAQTLVTDHTSDYQQLQAAATKTGLTVPKGLDAGHDKMIAPFEKLKGVAFDRRFTRDMVSGHEKAVTAYKREATEASSPDIKSYASTALPTLQKHLDAAKNLEKKKE